MKKLNLKKDKISNLDLSTIKGGILASNMYTCKSHFPADCITNTDISKEYVCITN